MTTGIVVALPAESRTLTRRAVKPGAYFFLPGAIVGVAGMGERRAQHTAEQLLQQGVKRLMTWGCAGALTATLRAGDVVLPQYVISDDSTCRIACDPRWQQHAENVLRARGLVLHNGALCHATRVLTSAAEKQRLGAACGAIAVDMESLAVARVAQQAAVPFLALRAIADTIAMTLPTAVQRSLRDDGQSRVSVLLWHLLRAPSQIPELVRLAHSFGRAQTSLRCVAAAIESLLTF